MEHYQVTGMSCASCSAHVEKAVKGVAGVSSCSVSLLTNSMTVEGSAKSQDIIKAVEDAGYGASLQGQARQASHASEEAALEDHETPALRKRLFWSIGFLLVLMYFSMGAHMWDWPVPAFLQGNHVAMGLLQMILAAIVMVVNQKFFISGTKGLVHRAPNMDTLVAMGSAASFIWSTVVLFLMTGAVLAGDSGRVLRLMDEFYFESAAMILTLITVGKMLEAMSKGRTTDALKSLMRLAPRNATLVVDGKETVVPIEDVQKDAVFVVRPGEAIPVDGVVTDGASAINEAALTGESIPVDKQKGDLVSAGTINQSGFLTCRATRVGEDTTLSQIIQMVGDAAATKAPIAKIADKVSGIFVPAVISVAVVTLVIWLAAGADFGFALARAISVLVISCPCALGLATPVAIMVGSGKGAKNGILFKTAASLEECGRVDIVALDKTGTITSGEPKVTDLVPAEGIDEKTLLGKAYALESQSEHPLSKAIMQEGRKRTLPLARVTDFKALSGSGLTANLEGQALVGGNQTFVEGYAPIDETARKAAHSLAEQGKTPLFFAQAGRFLGIIAVADVIKSDSAQAIKELKGMGIKVVMLTGDNERTAQAIGKEAGVDEVYASVKPDGKEAVIRSLQTQGKVAMVGDGINDAPALTRADIGIAIGAGTDVAIDAADVVLMKSKLTDASAAIRLSRATLRNIHENLFWAFFYNVIGIPLAAGAYIHLFGWAMNPMFGAAAMSLSSFCVVTNALRLNLFNVHDARNDRKKTQKIGKKDTKSMTKTMKINGMMCGHCEARVQKALESIDHVTSAKADHVKGEAVVTMDAPVDNAVLTKAVTDQEYEVVDIK